MRTLSTIALTSLFWFGSAVLIAGAYIVGSYQAGNVLYVIEMPREQKLVAADDLAIQQWQAATQDTFPLAYEAKKSR